MSEQTFIIISCTSTYGVLLCVKFNKKNTLDGFEGLQGKNQGKKLKKKISPPPPPSNNFCVVSRNGGSANFS